MSGRDWIRWLSPEQRAAMREDYEERAAIMEYDGGLARAEAERAAARRIRDRWEVF